MSTGASLNRGGSEQSVGTPQSFVDACSRKWGPVMCDLAASSDNAKSPHYLTEEDDSLSKDWTQFAPVVFWLNPPYSNIGKWAKKSVESGIKILMLVPASVGSNWYRDFVFRKAQTVFINGRIKFLGSTQPYPKDLMLCVFGFEQRDFEIWTPTKEELS